MGALGEGSTNLNDDMGGGTFWERKGVKRALTSIEIKVSEFERYYTNTHTSIHHHDSSRVVWKRGSRYPCIPLICTQE